MKKELKDDWTPQAGEWVLVSNDNVVWDKRLFVCVWKDKYRCEALGSTDYIIAWQHIRQIKPETMTLQEVRDALLSSDNGFGLAVRLGLISTNFKLKYKC
jgi:hypothetical protein